MGRTVGALRGFLADGDAARQPAPPGAAVRRHPAGPARPPRPAAAVLAFADCGVSLSEAAKRLQVHPNTISFRLTRWHDLTGADPPDLRRPHPPGARLPDGAPVGDRHHRDRRLCAVTSRGAPARPCGRGMH
ncbi:helix-turn-helix domain-containing protein [Streptomyces decoyicus]|uniref:helix-turn-helix domain-containing protein n=1 Tax=Streptomyces decoyicus TaxID=249567 RepID=UPI00398CC6C8